MSFLVINDYDINITNILVFQALLLVVLQLEVYLACSMHCHDISQKFTFTTRRTLRKSWPIKQK